jgi:hypothetical protein
VVITSKRNAAPVHQEPPALFIAYMIMKAKQDQKYILEQLHKEAAELKKHGLVAIPMVYYDYFKGHKQQPTIEEIKTDYHSGRQAQEVYCKVCPVCRKPRVVGTNLKDAKKAKAVCLKCSNAKKKNATLPPRVKEYNIRITESIPKGSIITVVITNGSATIKKREMS